MQLAPSGRLERIHPLVDETQDNRAALGLNLLLDPNRSEAAIKGIESRETSAPCRCLYGPLKPLKTLLLDAFGPRSLGLCRGDWPCAASPGWHRTHCPARRLHPLRAPADAGRVVRGAARKRIHH